MATSPTDEQIVSAVLDLTKPGEDEHLKRRRRFDNAYEIYRPPTRRRDKSLEPWQSHLRVPYAMQVIDTALVNIVQGKPKIKVRPRHPDVEENAKAMQIVLDYYVGEDHLVEKQPLFAQQALIFGVTIAKNHWVYQTRIHPKQGSKIVRDGPTFEPWSVYDAWWDPSARDIDTARYVVLRSYLSRDQLLANACTSNHDIEPCNGIYHNVERLLKLGATSTPSLTAQQKFVGSKQQSFKDLFEILETWTDNSVLTTGSRQVLLRNEDNPFWHGKKPIVASQTRPDLFEMLGLSETEMVDHIQQTMWTLQNMTIDNLHLTTMRGFTYREGGVTDPNQLKVKPRALIPVVDHDDLKPIEVAPVSSDVFQERIRLQSDMQLVTGINPYVSGADAQGVDQNTATGITALQEVASRLLRFKASQLQNAYQRSFEMWGDMVQQFMDKEIYVQIAGQDGNPKWLEVTPDMVSGHFNYVMEGGEESLSRQQERGEAIAVWNAFAPAIQEGLVNPKPLLERVASAYNIENPESLFAQPQQQQPPAAPLNGAQQPQQNQIQQLISGRS